MMNDEELKLLAQRRSVYRPARGRRRHDWRGWIIAMAAVVLVAAAMALAYEAESAGPPWPPADTQPKTPAPAGRHETRLYCRNFVQRPAQRAECRRLGGYR